MHRLVAFVLVLLLAASGAAAQESAPLRLKGIKGNDDRFMANGFEAPWSVVGRLNNRGGGYCTGVLVGPAVAVTAAHCLWNKKTRRWLPVDAVHFVAGYDRGEWLAHSGVTGFDLGTDDADTLRRLDSSGNDWAVVKLAQPIGLDVGWAGLSEHGASGPFTQIGYSQDKKHVPTAHVACRVDRFVNGGALMLHGCDAGHGDSGSPLFVWRDGQPRLAAIHVSTISLKQRQGVLGGAVPVSVFGPTARRMGARTASYTGPLALSPFTTVHHLLQGLERDTRSLEDAIRAYQRETGLAETGAPSVPLVAKLARDFERDSP